MNINQMQNQLGNYLTILLTRRKLSVSCLPSYVIFKSNEEEIFNPTHKANRFCEYFTNIGPNLAKSIPASDKSHRSFLNGGFINSFFLQSASEQEVTERESSTIASLIF